MYSVQCAERVERSVVCVEAADLRTSTAAALPTSLCSSRVCCHLSSLHSTATSPPPASPHPYPPHDACMQAPLFTQKADLFHDSVFVVGQDTAARLVRPDYYGNNDQAMLLQVCWGQCAVVVRRGRGWGVGVVGAVMRGGGGVL